MITKNKLEILNLFRRNIFLKMSILRLAKELKKKSYAKIHNAVKELEKDKIVKSEKIGNSNIISIELNSETILELSYLDEQEAHYKNIPNITKILDFKEFLDDIIIVTGSYASNKQTSKSDIDLVIITKEDPFKKQKLVDNITSLFLPKFHPIVISYKDFIEMLLDTKENYGKEIFKNKLLFRNSRRYYELIKEAIKNGFRG